MSRDPLKLTVTLDPGKVHLDRDVLLTVRVEAPSEVDVTLPSMDDRCEGFIVAGSFDRGPFVNRGMVTTERHVRLTPTLSGTYRIAPFAVTYRNGSVNPARTSWFATRPILLEAVPPVEGDPGSSIRAKLEPVWIYPPFRTVARWVLAALAAVALLLLAWKLLKRLHRRIRLMRMSPRERALEELTELLAKDLVGHHLVKEFYLELTMIVRRYIERAHAVRAPEQTTEEFLAAVSCDPRFSPDVVRKLRAFLQAADLVKFAAHRPEAGAVDAATRTAREYIETDAEEPQPPEET